MNTKILSKHLKNLWNVEMKTGSASGPLLFKLLSKLVSSWSANYQHINRKLEQNDNNKK